ncbi:CopG family transcriptional regulator [Tsukamurella sputi]|uniref:CopG family transcriptional regulator n=1 Tax=Tsukamurella sputi TaxID=2591848 RepID=A0A5C5RSG1_9ACTN|nr:CopG family transcriptional regulator [Tsukamurella sputi]TWS25714.1 CopG family transcriptional regulator [Tsukamurella sputi]
MGDEVKQFNVYLPAALIKRIKLHALETEQSLSALSAAALTEYLAAHSPDPATEE